mmetsp:Transcript_7281/g.11094  ORF Transcript_7281/g.11094 Transcript_7281/m.11094 type:complete len:82 (-) Transcript_7281:185-430(-)
MLDCSNRSKGNSNNNKDKNKNKDKNNIYCNKIAQCSDGFLAVGLQVGYTCTFLFNALYLYQERKKYFIFVTKEISLFKFFK